MKPLGTSRFTKPVYLGAPTRSPIGKFGGSLRFLPAPALAAAVLKACIERGGRADGAGPGTLVLLGHARQAGTGPNPARQAAIAAGLPESVPAITVNQACASGMTAIFAGVEKLALGLAREVYAGGVESMSNTPYLLPETRWGHKMGHTQILDGMVKDGFFCPMSGMVMGETVEKYLASELGITRAEQDAYALSSQERAAVAWKAGHFSGEVCALPSDGKNPALTTDEHLRAGSTLEALAKLPPVFGKDGTITAGNSSGITDGAAFVRLSLEKTPDAVAEILDYETVALDPKRMGLGPVPAIRNLLARQGLQVSDIEAFEINEAFAAQVIACNRELRIPPEKLNAWGGSIAIGHPIGASGARVTVTLTSRLRGKPGALGIAALCVSGGMGVAILVRAI